MKKYYHVVLINFESEKPAYIINRYVKGLREARAVLPFPVSYSRNAKAFTGWQGKLNGIIKEV